MKKYSITTALVAVFAFAPATASAAQQDRPTLCERAYEVRQVVVKVHGKQAPGRNICRFGIKSQYNKKWTKDATYVQKSQYVAQMKRLLRPAPSPFLVRAAVPPAQAPAGTLTASAKAPAGGILARIRACESGGNYSTNTGNGYYGAYQFDQQTWNSVGGSGSPAAASPGEQDIRAAALLKQRGTSPWPVCGR